MQVKITGKNLDIGNSLRTHVENRLLGIAEKYFGGSVSSHVTVEKQKSNFTSDCTLHLATGLVLQARGSGAEALPCFDQAAGNLEKQLRRYKRRLKDHHTSRAQPVRQFEATNYVIASPGHTEDTEEPEDLNPVIVAESSSNVPELSVGEAVMQLDISDDSFLMFRNVRDGGINVIYRRPDGNIGWIDPQLSANR
ncbi:ribosome-associated translation inhibitor RaiA [soil metagenome]